MKLTRLTLKNFGIFRESRSFEFDDQLTVIYGDNFTGKTTLARAIYFAVCGKVLSSGIKPSELAATPDQRAHATVIYTHDTHTYFIEHSTKGKLRGGYLQHNTWQVQADASPPLPSLNPQQWQIGCFLQEDELGEFLTKTPANRRDLLNQLLGIAHLRMVQETLINVRRLAKRVEKTTLDQQRHVQAEHLQDWTAEVAIARSEVITLERQLQALPDNQGQQRLAQEWHTQQEYLTRQIATLHTEVAALLAGFTNITELEQTLQQSQQRLAGREEAIRAREVCRERRASLAAETQQNETLLTKLSGLHGTERCPTCQQILPASHLQQIERAAQEQCEFLRGCLQEVEGEERDARAAVTLFEELAQRAAELTRRHAKIELLTRNIHDLQAQLDDVDGKLATVPDSGSAERDRDAFQREWERARARLAELEARQAQFQAHQEQQATFSQRAQAATHQRLISEWVAEAMEQTVQEVIGLSLREAERQVLHCLRNFQLLRANAPALELETSGLMPDLNGRTFQMLSGSERAILYVGMKAAIAQLLPGADFFVLDNPTLHLDQRRSAQLRDYLLSLLPAKQIILLTNDNRFAAQFSEGQRIDLGATA